MRASVVIPVRDRVVLTAQTLDWLQAGLGETDLVEIVVVDDGSTDATVDLMKARAPRATVVRHDESRGFAAACNAGAAVAAGDVVVFLNNDLTPIEGWLTTLLEYLVGHEEVGAAGSKLLDSRSRVQHAGIVICHDGLPRHAYRGFPREHPAVQRSRSVSAVTGACLAIRGELLESLDGFDEAFVNGFEDVDLCLRLRELGHEVHYCHASELHHLESATRVREGGTDSRYERNARLFLDRWTGRVAPDDLTTYVADGLISIDYSDVFPLSVRLSPELALPELDGATAELAELLGIRSRQVFDLLKENLALRVRLGELELREAAPDWLARAEPRDPFGTS